MVLDLAPLKLETRARRQIRNNPRIEPDPALLKIKLQIHQTAHPAATLRSATAVYNCFGMVFASRRTCILEEDEVQKILRDDEYRPTTLAGLKEGDLVVYGTARGRTDHVGIVTAFDLTDPSTVWVLSQWGQVGEWKHEINDVPPLLGQPTAFWTDRRTIDDNS